MGGEKKTLSLWVITVDLRIPRSLQTLLSADWAGQWTQAPTYLTSVWTVHTEVTTIQCPHFSSEPIEANMKAFAQKTKQKKEKADVKMCALLQELSW